MTGTIKKTAAVDALAANSAELEKINKYTLEELKPEEVYTFKIAVCSNAQDTDRDNEPFMLKSVEQLAEKLKGKTVLNDHDPTTKNQTARIYDTVLEKTDILTEIGEPLTRLIAHSYMVKTAGNADLIAEIKGGIKKEVSVGLSTSKCKCSICGKDFGYCPHQKGQTYDGKTCRAMISDCTDAYEVSFVAVPCQVDAGTKKEFAPGYLQSNAQREKELKAKIRLNEILFKEE